jgi:hypothetical protein
MRNRKILLIVMFLGHLDDSRALARLMEASKSTHISDRRNALADGWHTLVHTADRRVEMVFREKGLHRIELGTGTEDMSGMASDSRAIETKHVAVAKGVSKSISGTDSRAVSSFALKSLIVLGKLKGIQRSSRIGLDTSILRQYWMNRASVSKFLNFNFMQLMNCSFVCNPKDPRSRLSPLESSHIIKKHVIAIFGVNSFRKMVSCCLSIW